MVYFSSGILLFSPEFMGVSYLQNYYQLFRYSSIFILVVSMNIPLLSYFWVCKQVAIDQEDEDEAAKLLEALDKSLKEKLRVYK